jgi:DNA-binding CsgD family transcriptional regulator
MTETGTLLRKCLTPAEKQTAAWLCEGLSNGELAERAGVNEQAIKNRLRQIYDKTGVRTRLELVLKLIYHGAVACPCERCRASREGADCSSNAAPQESPSQFAVHIRRKSREITQSVQ